MKKIGIVFVIIAMLLCGCNGNIKDGKAFLEGEQYEEAKEAFGKEIQEERHLKEAFYGYGIACFELEEYEEAVESFEKAIQFGAEQDAVFHSFLGASYLETERFDKAIQEYKEALVDENITAELKQEVRYNLIVAYEKNADWDLAKKELKDYKEDYPDDTRIKRDADFLETR